MKSGLSYFFIAGIIILSIFTSTVIWRSNNLKQVPTLNKNSYNPPRSSKYIPINSDLVFHWKLNPTQIPKYIESYQDQVNENLTNNKISLIRDSSFKLIGLDFTKEISSWVGDYGSFAVFNKNNKPINDWVIVLGIKDDVNIEDDLAYTSDSKNIDKNIRSINSSSSSKIEIISKTINSNYSIYFAKIEDNVLIASNPSIIKYSIEESNSNKLNTKKMYKYIQITDNLNDGFLLLEMSPGKIFNLLGQEEKIFSLNEVKDLISSVNIKKNELNLQGILSFNIKTEMPAKKIEFNFIDILKKSPLSGDFILLDNPYQYFREEPNHPYQKIISSLIKESATSDYSNLFKIILEKSKGNLIWIKDKDWFILTSKSDTSKKEISDIFKQNEFLSSNLDFQDRNLEIWSKISTDGSEKYKIKENIEAIIDEDEKTYFWSQNLSSISNFDNINYLKDHSNREVNFEKIDGFDDILQIRLGEEKSKAVLNNFYPYILLRTMLGNKLTTPKNIDISIAVPKINYPDFIKFKINLKTS
tara:strand:- start:123 stop:1709 length:1587 start_codon:yes stop_codon:yes gene_type:complete